MTNSIYAQTVHLVDDLVIGDDESKGRDYLFGAPTHLDTDSQGNIYVRNHPEQSIRVYDRNGNFLRRIGRSGQGPGEFQHISSMFINHKNELIVSDDLNRRFEIFNYQGEHIQGITFPTEEGLITPQFMGYWYDNYYLIHYFMPYDHSSNRMIHVYDSGFSKKHYSIASKHDIVSPENTLKNTFQRYEIIIGDRNTFFITYKLYDGSIHKYFREAKGKPWQHQRLSGKTISRTYKEISSQEFKQKRAHGVLSSGQEGSFTFRVYSSSRGSFKLKDGRIVIPFILEQGNVYNNYIDVYSKQGVFINRFEIQGFPQGTIDKNYIFNFLHYDEKKEFLYYVEGFNGYPVIHRAKLVFD